MARFHDLVGQMRNQGDGEEQLPATIFDDLLTEYDTAMEGAQETVKKKDDEISHVKGEVSRLKSANYDLLTQVSNGSDPIDPINVEEDDTVVTISSLFKPRN